MRRALPFRDKGKALRPAGRVGDKRVWTLTVRVLPGVGTKKIGVRLGRTVHVLLVRRA